MICLLAVKSQVIGLGLILTLGQLHFQKLPELFFPQYLLRQIVLCINVLGIPVTYLWKLHITIMNNKNVFSYGVNLNWVFCVEQNKYFMAQTINNLHIKQQEQSTVVLLAFNGLPSPSWWGWGWGGFWKTKGKKNLIQHHSQHSFLFRICDK